MAFKLMEESVIILRILYAGRDLEKTLKQLEP